MKFFADTAVVSEIQELEEEGLIDGVTTNPSLIASAGQDIMRTIERICAIVDGPVSAEVVASDRDGMIAEGRKLSAIAQNVVVKVPLTRAGLSACRTLRSEGTRVNVTLCFSPTQALLAAKAGASFISPFVGRLDDASSDGAELLRRIRCIYDTYGFETQVLAASLRSINQVTEAALAGSDCATMPPSLITKLFDHALTDIGLARFEADWKASGAQSI